MQRLRRGVRDGLIDPNFGLLSTQTRLLAERCQAFTPPRNVGQGRTAVSRDLSVIFRPLSQTSFLDKGLRKIIRTDDRPAWEEVSKRFNDSHNLKGTRAIGFSKEWHKRNRKARGRGSRGKGGNLGYVTLGPEAKQARAYIKEVRGFVGWAKAGWNAGVLHFGGRVASWIGKHGTARSHVLDGRAASDPFVKVSNVTGWAKYRNSEATRILGNAVSARARDMQSYFERMMRIAAAKAQNK